MYSSRFSYPAAGLTFSSLPFIASFSTPLFLLLFNQQLSDWWWVCSFALFTFPFLSFLWTSQQARTVALKESNVIDFDFNDSSILIVVMTAFLTLPLALLNLILSRPQALSPLSTLMAWGITLLSGVAALGSLFIALCTVYQTSKEIYEAPQKN